MSTVAADPLAFYREWIMGRGAFDPRDFGVDMDRDVFMDKVVEEFNDAYRGEWSIDELLLHPGAALRFCEDVRQRHFWPDAPDDVILRSIMIRRKNP